MLSPKYLEDLPEAILELYGQAEMDILADMARRISTYDYWIPAADWQAQKLVEAGVVKDDIIEIMSKLTGKSQAELRRLMQEAGSKTLESDAEIYEEHNLNVPSISGSKALKNVLNAGYKATNQTMKNLTKTIADTATKQFENALDNAWMQITSGAFDRVTAVRSAVKSLSSQGIGAITYPSGHVDSIEVAVRRAVVTGVNKTSSELQLTLADELGCDLVETTAHAGARPSHAEWQGKIFSRSGKSRKYPDFRQATGYGTGAGLCGWNCRHNFHPYFEGSPRTYSEEQLKEYEAKKYKYNGQEMTEYEASQQQRYIERRIRRWKRENVAMEAAGLDTTESALKIKQWQDTQKDFLRQTGLKRQSDREQIAGFGRSEASKATKAVYEAEKQANLYFNLGNTQKNLSAYIKEKSTIDMLNTYGVKYKWRISDKEIIVDAGKPAITEIRIHAADNLANKVDRSEMTKERAQTFVDDAKLTLFQAERNTLKFLAQDGYAILNFDFELVTAVPQKWRKKYDQYLGE